VDQPIARLLPTHFQTNAQKTLHPWPEFVSKHQSQCSGGVIPVNPAPDGAPKTYCPLPSWRLFQLEHKRPSATSPRFHCGICYGFLFNLTTHDTWLHQTNNILSPQFWRDTNKITENLLQTEVSVDNKNIAVFRNSLHRLHCLVRLYCGDADWQNTFVTARPSLSLFQ